MQRTELARRLGVSLAVVLVVLVVAASLPLVTQSGGPDEPLDTTEFSPATVVSEPIQSSGTVSPDVAEDDQSGVVYIDQAHGNDLSRAEMAPLVSALTATGHTVRMLDSTDDFTSELDDGKALVIVDPTLRYTTDELDTVEEFTDGGGHLLLVAEPDRIRPAAAAGNAVTQSSKVTQLASRHGISFDTRYLYDLETNDGNYKHVVATPAADAGLGGIERTTHYTATTVSARDGTPLLVTPETTHLSGGGPAAQHTVATQTENVLAVGDSTFLQADRHTVADNEEFVGYIVEFLATGEGG